MWPEDGFMSSQNTQLCLLHVTDLLNKNSCVDIFLKLLYIHNYTRCPTRKITLLCVMLA